MKTITNHKGRQTLLMLALAVGSSAYAQDDSAAVEEIIVTGTRSSLQNAIDYKRNATGIVDAISPCVSMT